VIRAPVKESKPGPGARVPKGDAAMSSGVPDLAEVWEVVGEDRERGRAGKACKESLDSQQSRMMRISQGASSSCSCRLDQRRPGIRVYGFIGFLHPR
jgi:hypothetical protein